MTRFIQSRWSDATAVTRVGDTPPWYVRFFKGDYLRVYGHTLQQDRTDLETQFIIHALDIQPHNRVLDLCCGEGRHSIALAKTGLSVTGVDLSSEMLEIARQNATQQGIFSVEEEAGFVGEQVEYRNDEEGLVLYQADMRQLPDDFKDQFDVAINLFSSFGYLESEDDDQRVLHQIASSLKPGGKLLIDLLNREWVIINNEEYDWHQHEDGRLVLEHRDFSLEHSVNHITYTEISLDGTRREMSDLRMRLYSLTELIKMFKTAGLSFRAVYGGFRGEEYSVNTRRMIVVGTKPE